tara:strand:- start:338 stop:511 length:174 start_codon:yes stop_codon:yes gene_type:complete
MKNFLKAFFLGKLEDLVIDLLVKLAKRSDNKIDDRLVEAVVAAIENKSYLQVIKKFK